MSSKRWPAPRSLSPLPNVFMIYVTAVCARPLRPISLFITHCASLSRFIHFIMFSPVTFLISFLIFLLSSLAGSCRALPSPRCPSLHLLHPSARDQGLPL